MNNITFQKLYSIDFDLKCTFAMRQKWSRGTVFNMSVPRKTTGIIFLNNCTAVYKSKDGNSFTAPQKSIVCLPFGSEYTCLNSDCTSTLNDAILIEFNIIRNDEILTFSDSPFIIKDIPTPIAAELFNNVVKAYESSINSPLEVKSQIFSLLSLICKEKVLIDNKRFDIIRNGIELIESNALSNVSIEEIAKSCNVSSGYFRRLFKEYSGKSPVEYRIDLRLEIAKRMLENGEAKLEYISDTLGFESVSYFCKIFKKKYGITAGNFRKSINVL